MSRLFNDDQPWIRVSCSAEKVYTMFTRHYSFDKLKNRKGKNAKRVVGPGQEITLISQDDKAIFVWRKEKFRRDSQTGVNCAIFRNEGSRYLSSDLIKAAEVIAWKKWPGERLFTFVNQSQVKWKKNPGYCFEMAGWKLCGVTQVNKLLIFEKIKLSQI